MDGKLVLDDRKAERDFYERLNCVRSATASQIKAEFSVIARRLHPDRGGDAAAMELVLRAYKVLSDPKERAIYDAFLDSELKVAYDTFRHHMTSHACTHWTHSRPTPTIDDSSSSSTTMKSEPEAPKHGPTEKPEGAKSDVYVPNVYSRFRQGLI